jgi:hypothetical protein
LAGAKARSSELKPRIENMKNLFHRFIADQSGVAAIEYGLIARSDRCCYHQRGDSARHQCREQILNDRECLDLIVP